jgi:hypothetical protein
MSLVHPDPSRDLSGAVDRRADGRDGPAVPHQFAGGAGLLGEAADDEMSGDIEGSSTVVLDRSGSKDRRPCGNQQLGKSADEIHLDWRSALTSCDGTVTNALHKAIEGQSIKTKPRLPQQPGFSLPRSAIPANPSLPKNRLRR